MFLISPNLWKLPSHESDGAWTDSYDGLGTWHGWGLFWKKREWRLLLNTNPMHWGLANSAVDEETSLVHLFPTFLSLCSSASLFSLSLSCLSPLFLYSSCLSLFPVSPPPYVVVSVLCVTPTLWFTSVIHELLLPRLLLLKNLPTAWDSQLASSTLIS